MNEKLKPCPFCGGKANLYYNDFLEDFKLTCEWCGVTIKGYSTREKAINAWNTRIKE